MKATAEALLDTSAWARLRDGRLDPGAVLEDLAAGRLGVCEPLLLEMRFSAKDASSFRDLAEELGALPLLTLTASAASRAVAAQGELAADRRVSHRVKPIDFLVAAVADEHNVDVVHYDHDFDIVARHTSLSFQSRWIAARGSLT